MSLINKKRKLFAIIAFLLLFSLFFSNMSVITYADINDVDVTGVSINDNLDTFIIDFLLEFYMYDMQLNSNNAIFIFIDSQLLEFDFITRFIDKYGYEHTAEGVASFFESEHIYLWVHRGEMIYTNYTEMCRDIIEGETNAESNNTFDFSNNISFNSLCGFVGQVSMCAVGIWHIGDDQEDLWYNLQNEWHELNKNMPVYVIEREPLNYTNSGLMLEYYDFDNRHFSYDPR